MKRMFFVLLAIISISCSKGKPIFDKTWDTLPLKDSAKSELKQIVEEEIEKVKIFILLLKQDIERAFLK